MRRTGRIWIVSLLWVNVSVLLVVAVQTAGTSAWEAQNLLRAWAYSLVRSAMETPIGREYTKTSLPRRT